MNKLTQAQYYELQTQFEKTPPLGEQSEQIGEHYLLMHILAKFGYRENDTAKAMLLAERLLNNGY